MLGRVRRSGGRSWGTAERVTVGLAGVTLAAGGALVAGEVARMVRRRRESRQVPTPETLGDAAELATRDTLAVARIAYESAPRHETVLFNVFSGFLGAFALVRLSTWGIRGGWWPTGNVVVRERHVHHFVPGILIAFVCGGAGLATQNERAEEILAVGFGAGVGLTFDEAALLLELRDVYWSREGLLSIQISLGVTAVLAAALLTLRMLRRGERKGIEEGVIPAIDGQASSADLA